jgi:hypothetical protein
MPSRSSVAQWAALLIGLPLLALALVVVADAIPDRFVLYRLRDAIEAGQLDEQSYSVGYAGGQVDGYSECKRMTVGLGVPPGTNTLESAVRSFTLGPCETAVPEVLDWADGSELTRSYQYFQYWNGSAVLLRPTVAAVGLAGTRVLAAIAIAAASIVLLWRVARAVGGVSAGLLGAPLLLTTDFIDLPGALVQAIGMIVALTAAALLLWFLRPSAGPSTYAAAAFACGAASQFFGDLTNPDAAWALVVAGSAMLAVGAHRSGPAVGRVVAATVGWIGGFAWIWFSKWVIAAVVIGYDTVRFVVTNKTEERLAGDVDGVDPSLTSGLSAAWRLWSERPLTTLTMLTLGVVAIVIVVRRRDLASTWQPRLLLASAAVIPIVWHLVMRNHTGVHFWFTYRSLAVAAGIVLMAATAHPLRQGSDPRRNEPDGVVEPTVTPGV